MEHFYEILWGIVGTIASGLATWLVFAITSWLNSKIKDKKAAKMMSDILNIINIVIQKLLQITVDDLKKHNKFDKEAQERIKAEAVTEIKKLLTEEQADYIKTIATDVDEWLNAQIETTVRMLKK